MRAMYLGLGFVLALTAGAWAKNDGPSDRVTVRGDKIFRGTSPKPILAVQMVDLCRPDVTDEELTKAFVKVSEVGGTAFAIDLRGFNSDGTTLDPKQVEAVMKIKDASNGHWMPTVLRVLASLPDAKDDVRMNAVKTAAAAFGEQHSVIYWIDGPHSDALARAFHQAAPKPLVLSPSDGDVQLVTDAKSAAAGHPALVLGALPPKGGAMLNCILPDTPETYKALEEYNTLPIERAPWKPSKYGLSRKERADGWISLFDGKSLKGWTILGENQKGFVVENGAICWAASGGRELQSRDRYGNFLLRVEWKVAGPNINNGIHLRSGRANRSSRNGFEFQMLGDYGKKADKESTGSVYEVVAPTSAAQKPDGEWNDLELTLNGSMYKATLNGVVIQDLDFDKIPEMKNRLRNGFVCITDHGGKACFRHIRIKKL